jgi:hypothetical protein
VVANANKKGAVMSAKTVADKLLIKSDATLWSSHPDRIGLIGPLPSGVRTVERLDQAKTALVFADDADSLRELLARHGDQLTRPNILWVSYPKANRTDLNRDTLWPILAEYGMRPVGQVAVDEVWSALRFRPLKEGEPPFTGGR